ncbi:hypothetical protein E3V36_06940 [Candidatus Marinimicrobia bacterium MT.SAG.2]|nr:hypothetical protein E3V36_06940 [Candidatus Marinimicrobia bacterium MT.SAG.2]
MGCSFLCLILFSSSSLSWGQVTPEFELASKGVMSFNVDKLSDSSASAINDFSDSGLMIGFRQKLYSNYRGQMVIGFQFPDADSDLGQIFFNQMFLKIESKSNILKMGRSRVKSALIDFPTLRDDDAIPFTDVLNPFSTGENSEDNQYGNVSEVAHLFGQRYWLRIHGEHFTETPIPPATVETDFSINSIGLSLEYRVPQTQVWNRGILSQVGISSNNFLNVPLLYSSDINQALKNFIFSTILNVHPDPVHFLDLRHQTILNFGFDEIKDISNNSELTRAKSFATFTSLRYLYRRLERPSGQLSLSFGYKSYSDLLNTTNQFQTVVNGFYRLGENFDAGLQYGYSVFNGDLESLFGEHEHRIKVALVFSVDELWNEQFDDRESLLNLEHGYIP